MIKGTKLIVSILACIAHYAIGCPINTHTHTYTERLEETRPVLDLVQEHQKVYNYRYILSESISRGQAGSSHIHNVQGKHYHVVSNTKCLDPMTKRSLKSREDPATQVLNFRTDCWALSLSLSLSLSLPLSLSLSQSRSTGCCMDHLVQWQ